MYKVTRVERFNDTVFVDDFKFSSREEAEECFTRNSEKDCVVDITLFYCIPYGDDKELTRYVREKPGKGIARWKRVGKAEVK